MNQPPEDVALERITADIVIAFLGSQTVAAAELPQLVLQVKSALCAAANDLGPPALQSLHLAPARPVQTDAPVAAPVTAAAPAVRPPLTPAVPVDQSVYPDYIVSLEDGRKYKSLKRHLMAKHKMTPDEYRSKWNLPAGYPMVAPNYAQKRSDLAKGFGLGKTTRRPGPPKRRAAAG